MQGQPLRIEEQHCTVVALSARHLLVNVAAPHFKCIFLVAHSPTDPQDVKGEVAAFWRQRASEIARIPGRLPLILLTDANGRVGSNVSPAVGQLDAEEENPAGGALHDFLLSHNLCIPATFAGCHTGESWTWCSALGDRHRIDYIAVPQSWLGFDLRSRTWPELEAMQKRLDHIPACLTGAFLRSTADGPGAAVGFKRVACRPNDLDPGLDQTKFLQCVQSAPLPSWSQDVDMHFSTFVCTWTAAGSAVAVEGAPPARQTFLSAATMQLVEARKDLRKYLRQEEIELKRRYQLIGFAAFILQRRGQAAPSHIAARAAFWLRSLHVSIARAWSYLNHTCEALRGAVRRERNQYLDQLVKEVGQTGVGCPKQLFYRARKAFPKASSARRSRFVALPAVELENGDLAVSSDDRMQRWRAHFADQESGVPADGEDYSKLFCAVDLQRPCNPVLFDQAMLPSLVALESSVLDLKRAKAAGADGITAELLRVAPTVAARHLISLHLKSTLSLREPVEFKGGSLMTLAKKASAAFGCHKYRSILLSSVAGKLYHRELRGKLLPALRAHCPDLHGGVREGVGVDTISLAAKCFRALSVHAGLLPALVFFDVRAAYYQVIRECITGAPADDRVLLRFFHRLGVPAAAFEELKEQLSRLAFLPDYGCSEHATAMIREMFSGTWFRMDRSAPMIATVAGVRPGDPLADILFAISFSAYSSSVGLALDSKNLGTVLPASAQAPPWEDVPKPLSLGPASWADDFVAMHSAPDPDALIGLVRAATEVYLSHATSNGIELAFAPDKTAAVLPPRACFHETLARDPSGGELYMQVVDAVSGQAHRMPVVQAYKHLGGIMTSSGTVVPEIHYRASQVSWSLRPLRSVLFGNPSVPLATRRHLLQSLVISRFVFGSATLEFRVAGHFRLWARLYTSMFRALQPKHALQGKLHSYSLLHTASACSPTLALAKARAGFVTRLVTHGPGTLQRLLWLQWEAAPSHSWLGQLVDDLHHVALYCPGVKVVLQTACPVRALLEAILEDQTWWKRQVAAAIRICLKDLERWHMARSASVAQTDEDVGVLRLILRLKPSLSVLSAMPAFL